VKPERTFPFLETKRIRCPAPASTSGSFVRRFIDGLASLPGTGVTRLPPTSSGNNHVLVPSRSVFLFFFFKEEEEEEQNDDISQKNTFAYGVASVQLLPFRVDLILRFVITNYYCVI
jgi:hypothetical protein